MKDKEVFNFSALNTDKLALSLGLATAPQIAVKSSSAEAKNAQRDTLDGEDKPRQSRL
jgi:hypothetical protein